MRRQGGMGWSICRGPCWLSPRAVTGRLRRLAGSTLTLLLPMLAALLVAGLSAAPAQALKSIPIASDAERIEITSLGDIYEGRGDSLQLETAAGADGVSGRMSVRAATAGTNPNWMVFALTNPSDKPVERWLTAERYTVIGSGAVWPDLDARRIEAVTPSVGFIPERIKSDRADIFRITLEPGQTITYAAELSSERFARVYLWKPIDYEVKTRDRQLFNGIMLGLTGLLAVFLTAIFAANHKAIFPSAALVSWCVLCYLSVDFGFFHKLFNLRPEDNAVYRAAGEAAVSASLVIFLHTFLRLGLWHGIIRMLIAVWMLGQLTLIAVAVIDPRLAATFARLSFLAIGGLGGLFTLFLALRGQDRAMSLIPTWLLFLVWTFAAGVVLTGRLSGDIVVSGLVAGLVLIVMLIGFTVTQYAFRSVEPVYGAAPGEAQMRALAIDGAGAAVWEWNARRDEIKVSPLVETALGLNSGELSAKVDDFMNHMHQADRERFRLMLWSIQERAGGNIRIDFRMRHADNSYRCFELEAASMPSDDRRVVRCLGLMRDITDARRAYERLMHDAVHCSLTGLPYRELVLDRLATAVMRAKAEPTVRPTIIFIDIDKFKSVNTSFGLVVGDSLLLTTARRLQRHLGPQDTLGRVGGDQFAILLVGEQDPRDLAQLAERIRRSLRAPIKIAGQEIVLTGSLGIAVYDGEEAEPSALLKEAEIAMYRAKRGGADRIEIFRPDMRAERDDRVTIESDLRKALEKGQLRVLYQPIVYLHNEELAGFEALVRWEHPKLGLLNPARFVPVAEESDLIVKLGSYVLLTAASDAARWQREMPRPEAPLFVSVNVSSRQLFRQDLIQEIRHILGRDIVPRGALKLEVTESLVMENPEQATEILELLRGAGAELALDDFGTGYSSLAYLQRFPFDTIKLDRALVQAAGSGDAAGTAIVRSMVALSHELSKKVVAEGVETAEDVAFLRGIGCEFAQGFFYGAAIPDKEVLALLRMVKKSERKLQPRGFFRMARTKRGKTPAEIAASVAGGAAAEARKSKVMGGDRTKTAGADQDAGPDASPQAGADTAVASGAAPAGSRPAVHMPKTTVKPRRPSKVVAEPVAPTAAPAVPLAGQAPDASSAAPAAPAATPLPAVSRPAGPVGLGAPHPGSAPVGPMGTGAGAGPAILPPAVVAGAFADGSQFPGQSLATVQPGPMSAPPQHPAILSPAWPAHAPAAVSAPMTGAALAPAPMAPPAPPVAAPPAVSPAQPALAAEITAPEPHAQPIQAQPAGQLAPLDEPAVPPVAMPQMAAPQRPVVPSAPETAPPQAAPPQAAPPQAAVVSPQVAPQAVRRPAPAPRLRQADQTLPPSIAASLAKLAGPRAPQLEAERAAKQGEANGESAASDDADASRRRAAASDR